MCCEGPNYSYDDVDGVCPDCGEDTVDGSAIDACGYSEVQCDTCGHAPCQDYC